MGASEFLAERRSRITKQITRDIVSGSRPDTSAPSLVECEYVKNFTWMGIPVIQYPSDLIMLQEIIWETTPTYIIECGVAFGGLSLFMASVLEGIGRGTVLCIEKEMRPENRSALIRSPYYWRMDIIDGSSTDPKTVANVDSSPGIKGGAMVVLDSNHTEEHVLRELEIYSKYVPVGGYMVVFDTAIEIYGHLDKNQDRPWGKGNNPMTAVYKWLRANKNWTADIQAEYTALITSAPLGWLRRTE